MWLVCGRVLLYFGLVLCYASADDSATVTNPIAEYDPATCRNGYLANSTWPSDHGDSSRTKYTIGAGLPKDVKQDQIRILRQPDLKRVQWLYTAGQKSEFLYVMGGMPIGTYIAKVNSKTLEVLQKVDLPPAMYLGGLLMHANGDVYGVQGNRFVRFKHGDLLQRDEIVLPTRLNTAVVQMNGCVVTSDGMIVVKQWGLNVWDVFGITFNFFPQFVLVLYPVCIFMGVTVAILMRLKPSKGRKAPTYMDILTRAVIGGAIGASFMLTLQMLGPTSVSKNEGEFSYYKYFLTNTPFGPQLGGGGELKVIDPNTLEVVADLYMEERCSFARMALASVSDTEDSIALLGDEFVHQYRWSSSTRKLYEIKEWAARYRTNGDGSFPGTGPAIHNGVAFFTDNTFPFQLSKTSSYSLFRRELDLPSNSTIERTSILDDPVSGATGFMFWSTTIAPQTNGAIVWDSANDNVKMFDVDTLKLRWKLHARTGDCVVVAADKGHVYLTNHTDSPGSWDKYGYSMASGFGRISYPNLQKHLMVADERTGDIIASVNLDYPADSFFPSMMIPGANNDVLISNVDELIRLYTEE